MWHIPEPGARITFAKGSKNTWGGSQAHGWTGSPAGHPCSVGILQRQGRLKGQAQKPELLALGVEWKVTGKYEVSETTDRYGVPCFNAECQSDAMTLCLIG